MPLTIVLLRLKIYIMIVGSGVYIFFLKQCFKDFSESDKWKRPSGVFLILSTLIISKLRLKDLSIA